MKVDYVDVSVIIEHIIEEAKDKGVKVTSVDDLYAYLEDNSSNEIEFIGHG